MTSDMWHVTENTWHIGCGEHFVKISVYNTVKCSKTHVLLKGISKLFKEKKKKKKNMKWPKCSKRKSCEQGDWLYKVVAGNVDDVREEGTLREGVVGEVNTYNCCLVTFTTEQTIKYVHTTLYYHLWEMPPPLGSPRTQNGHKIPNQLMMFCFRFFVSLNTKSNPPLLLDHLWATTTRCGLDTTHSVF